MKIILLLIALQSAQAATHYSKTIEVSTSKGGVAKTVEVLVEYKDGYGWNSYFPKESGLSQQEKERVAEYAVKSAKTKFEEAQEPAKLEIIDAKEAVK